LKINKGTIGGSMGLDQFIGLRLKHDLYNETGHFLLSKNVTFEEEHISKIIKHNIVLSKEDFIFEKKLNEQDRGKSFIKQMIQDTTEEIKEIFDLVRYTDDLSIVQFEQNILPSIHNISKDTNISSIFEELQTKDEYTYRHNIAVGVISTLLGKWIGLSETELNTLTIAATLHDIGKMKIPLDVLNKPGRLTEDEYEIVKGHTIYGFEILKNTVGISNEVSLVALQHHEREDGSGYPYGLMGDKINLLSKIVAVADIYHAMTSNRVYHEALPFFKVMKEMREGSFGHLDPKIVNVFMQHVMDSLIGTEVELSDGNKGTIIMVNTLDPINPLVQVEDKFIDLSRESNLKIENTLSFVDASPYKKQYYTTSIHPYEEKIRI
jgi:putative nucleotidyltransferase with HDIG domain